MDGSFSCVLLAAMMTSAAAGSTRQARFVRRPALNDVIIETPAGDREDSTVAKLSNVTSQAGCAARCLSEESCGSFFHHAASGLCLLHSVLFTTPAESAPYPGATYWQLTQDRCPSEDGWVLERTHGLCYRYFATAMTWDAAAADCQAQGSNLIAVPDQDVFRHLYLFLRGNPDIRMQHVSIGARDGIGGLAWRDGSPVTWEHWAAGEPSSVLEQCVTMAWFYYFQWNDVPCADAAVAKYNYLCQKTI